MEKFLLTLMAFIGYIVFGMLISGCLVFTISSFATLSVVIWTHEKHLFDMILDIFIGLKIWTTSFGTLLGLGMFIEDYIMKGTDT